jgi:hypothetical protein
MKLFIMQLSLTSCSLLPLSYVLIFSSSTPNQCFFLRMREQVLCPNVALYSEQFSTAVKFPLCIQNDSILISAGKLAIPSEVYHCGTY